MTNPKNPNPEKPIFNLGRLTHLLKQEIIGQDHAVDALVQSAIIGELGICDPRRPLGTFLFVGPTGTGKSQLGRSLAKIIHGSEDSALVINCTEFQNPHDVAKLTGAPPGYIGHENPPFITPEKLSQFFTIIIFEEIEKADPKFFDLMLQILEKGELTTGAGVRLDFMNCFIIMTSNAGAKELIEINKIGFNSPNWSEIADSKVVSICMDALKKTFKPEFLNRVDEIIVFNRLAEKHLFAILDKFLGETQVRLGMINIHLVIDDGAKNFLILRGTDIHYGARPLRRAIRKLLEFPLADFILQNRLRNCDIKIIAGNDQEKLIFQVLRNSKSAYVK